MGLVIARLQHRINQKVFTITANLRALHGRRFLFCTVIAKEHKKAFWVVHFDGCMRDG
jgi:hypothetical protein